MRHDLLHAQASVDWAVAHLPAFQARLRIWLDENVQVSIKELPADVPNNVVVATEKSQLPLDFQVEAGAYINAIRSSLDILASSLAARHCPNWIDDAYFPAASSASAFATGNYKGSKFVQALPAKERLIIEHCKPYKGGDTLIYPLHQLDIVRKHVRLLSAMIIPSRLGMRREALRFFEPLSIAWMRSADDETVLGLLAKDSPDPEFDFTAQVALDETAYFAGTEIITALKIFANAAQTIIGKFDYA